VSRRLVCHSPRACGAGAPGQVSHTAIASRQALRQIRHSVARARPWRREQRRHIDSARLCSLLLPRLRLRRGLRGDLRPLLCLLLLLLPHRTPLALALLGGLAPG
jgi:hypothetical protein